MARMSIAVTEIDLLCKQLRRSIEAAYDSSSKKFDSDSTVIVSYREALSNQRALSDREKREYADSIGDMVATSATRIFHEGHRQSGANDFIVIYVEAIHCFAAFNSEDIDQVHDAAKIFK